ncbi:MAG: hypothetical protein AAF985_26720, partial [Bacteroidota bacterium]
EQMGNQSTLDDLEQSLTRIIFLFLTHKVDVDIEAYNNEFFQVEVILDFIREMKKSSGINRI